MKLAFATLGCPEWTLEKIAEFAGKNGFEGIELRTSPEGDHLSDEAPVEEAARIRELFESKGTRAFSLMAYTRFSSTDPEELAKNRDRLLHVLDLAVAAGADFVRTFAGQFSGDKTREQAIADADVISVRSRSKMAAALRDMDRD